MKPGTKLAVALVVLVAVVIGVPACVSVASGDGQLCLASGDCPLSAVNPCVRKPFFAIVGRCGVAIK